MLDDLTANELAEWEAFDRLEPIGEWRDDYRLAYLSSLLTNIAISQSGRKNAKMTDPEKFLLTWGEYRFKDEKIRIQSVEEMKTALLGIAKVFGKKKKPVKDTGDKTVTLSPRQRRQGLTQNNETDV